MEITVKTQQELDAALAQKHREFTYIYIAGGTLYDRLYVRSKPVNAVVVARGSSHVEAWGSSHVVAWGSSHVVAWGSSHVEAWESSHVVARGSSHVEAWGSSHVVARGSSHVEAWGSSHVEAWGSSHVVAWGSSHVEAWESSHVVAWGSSHVEAWGSSHVEARGSSHVEAWESSHVVARGSSHVEAWGSSHVEAWESSHVEAWESSHVEAWESSHVEARGSSHVEAWGSVAVHGLSPDAAIELFGFAVAVLVHKAAKALKKSETATIVKTKAPTGTTGWLEGHGVPVERGHVVLYKRVSAQWQTQEGKTNETLWQPGTTLEHPAWNPKSGECGAGKYHACSRTYFCDEFRDKKDDRYVALKVAVADLYAWPEASYPHKIAFRAAEVLHEVDRAGRKIETAVKP